MKEGIRGRSLLEGRREEEEEESIVEKKKKKKLCPMIAVVLCEYIIQGFEKLATMGHKAFLPPPYVHCISIHGRITIRT